MSLEPDRIRAITFDSYSTLVDPRSAGRVLEPYTDAPGDLAARWHAVAVRYATVANDIDAYRTYFELHEDALAVLLESRGHSVSDEEITAIAEVYHDLEPFDDVRRGMERLDHAGYTLAILSNGDPDLLETLVETTESGDLLETTISADEIRTFKPESALYEHAAERLGVAIEEILHVGAGWGDVMGCTHAGMHGVWLNRTGEPWPRFDGDPDAVVASMDELADLVT